MGITNFFKILITDKNSKYFGKTIDELFKKEYNIAAFANKTLAVDASNIIYRAIKVVNEHNKLTDSEGNETNHLVTIFNQLVMFKKHNIKTIWIFDNPKMNKFKEQELKKRAEQRSKTTNAKAHIRLTEKHIKDTQKLLDMLGIAYIIAPENLEAEHIAAYTTIGKDKLCDYVLSGDSDVLIFGGDLLRAATDFHTGKKYYQLIEFSELISKLGIADKVAIDNNISAEDYEQINIFSKSDLIRISIYLGNDFYEGVPKVGEKTILKKYFSGNVIMDDEQNEILDYMLTDISEHFDGIKIIKTEAKYSELMEFLLAKGFNKEKLEKNIEILET